MNKLLELLKKKRNYVEEDQQPDLQKMLAEQDVNQIQEENPNMEMVTSSNPINDLLQSLFTERENRLDKKENDQIENEFFKALEEKRKERAMKVKEKYGK